MTTDYTLDTLTITDLRKLCPLKWHKDIPDDGVGMAIADIDFKGPSGLVTLLKDRLTDDYSSYGPFEGLESVIEIGKQFLELQGIPNVNPKQLQIIPGTMMGIFASMEYFSRKPGEITIINPIYPPIHMHAMKCGNPIRWVDLRIEEDWQLDHEALKKQIDSNTKLLVFNNPNNPTGSLYKKEDMKLFIDLAKDYEFPVFVDELYYPLIFNKNFVPFASQDSEVNSITLRGFSKSYGLAGWRSGFMHISHPEFVDIKYIVEQLIVSPSPVTSLVMDYALTSPVVKSWQNEFEKQIYENITFATKEFLEHGIECIKPDGCFFVFPKIRLDDVKFKSYLLKNFGVEIVPGSEFGPAGKEHIRINCATSFDRVNTGIKKILDGIKSFN